VDDDDAAAWRKCLLHVIQKLIGGSSAFQVYPPLDAGNSWDFNPSHRKA